MSNNFKNHYVYNKKRKPLHSRELVYPSKQNKCNCHKSIFRRYCPSWNKLLSFQTSQILASEHRILNACSFCIRDIYVIGSSLCNFPDVPLAVCFFKKSSMLLESRPESLKFNFPRNISHSIEYRVSDRRPSQFEPMQTLFFFSNWEMLKVGR